MNTRPILAIILELLSPPLGFCSRQTEAAHQEAHKITATIPQSTSVTLTERYVCQIRSKAHIKIRVLESGR